MQRSTAINAQDLCGFLELLLIGLVVIHIFIVVVIFILVPATGRSVSLPRLGLAAAYSSAGAFLAGSSSTFLGLLLVASLVFSLLLLDKLLDFLAALEVMALRPMDLVVRTIRLAGFLNSRYCCSTVSACRRFLAGATTFGFLGATSIAGLLND